MVEIPQSRLAVWRAGAVVVAAAILAGAVVLSSAGSAASSTLPRPSRALYYETAVGPAAHAIDKLNLSAPKVSTQVVNVGGASLFGIALGTGTIGRATLDGRNIDGRWLNIHSWQGPFQIVADRADIYWTWGGVSGLPSYTGRADANRSDLDRRFLANSLYPMVLSDTEPDGSR